MNENINSVLICSITPYFLEKRFFWFEKNLKKILEIRKLQSFWKDNTLFCEKDQKYQLSQFLRKLDELGYEKVFKISEPGEFSQRGGIVDVFPINSTNALRFDFLGNKIESIEKLSLKIKDETETKTLLKKKLKSQKLFSDLKNLKEGNYVVHLDHGIARFAGFQNLIQNTKYYILEYAQGDKLYVPVGLERKLSKYVGFVEPEISRLGTQVWQRTKRKAKEDAQKLTKELLTIYAQREVTKRPPYFSDSLIEQKIEATFPYEETPDQLQVLKELEQDLKKPKPIDRLICGDVGFGKTEIVLRIASLAVVNGRQVAFICPTTILAYQHYNTFKERLKDLPINIAILTRLENKKSQKEILKGIEKGKIDIIIGTHRLLSSDITPLLFEKSKGSGLLIIDDEHKFGVKQKEKLRKLKENLDILSLSATPIPRTLYLTLSGFKKISLIQTPPLGRLAIETHVLPYDEKIIKQAIEFELKRKGQVYFLHNFVKSIKDIKEKLHKLIPTAKIGILHGKLKEKDLVEVMNDFQKGKIDILVTTTIIESGLDLPKVNTLIVADSTRLGLSQAHQIRGRIGRRNLQSFAYFFYPKGKLEKKAKKRLKILKEAKKIGSGYQIALKDLELRGAGNILGKEQSGNINAVGLNLYCQMLSEAAEKLKK